MSTTPRGGPDGPLQPIPPSEEAAVNPTGQSAAPTSPPRKRRWLRRTLIALAVLIAGIAALTALAPTIASTGWGRQRVLGMVNPRLRGIVEVESWSLTWFDKCSVQGLHVRDPDDREVLRVDTVHLSRGLWHALTAPSDPGDVLISRPQVTLFIADDGSVSLVEAFASTDPKPPSAGGEPLDLKTGIELQDGVVRAVFADGRRADFSAVDAHIDVATAGALAATLSAVNDTGGRLRCEAKLNDWMHDGAFDTQRVSGNVRLDVDEAVDLALVDQLAALGAGLGGTATVHVAATMTQGNVEGEFKIAAKELRAAATAETVVTPVDFDLGGRVQLIGRDLSADVQAGGEWGNISGNLACTTDALASAKLDAGMFAALLAGEQRPIILPDLTLSASGRLDLAVLGRAVPTLLHVRPGTEITAGAVAIEQLALRGGEAPNMAASVQVTELTARDRDQLVRCEPISMNVDAVSTAERGLEVRRAALTTGFGAITASGTPGDVTAKLTTDLAELNRQLGRIFDLKLDDLSGNVSADLVAKRGEGDAVDLDVQAEAHELRYAAGNQRITARQLNVTHRGTLSARSEANGGTRWNGDVSAGALGLTAATTADVVVKPVDIELAGKGQLAGDALSTDITLRGAWGNLQSKFACALDELADFNVDENAVAALLAGERAAVVVPNMTLDARGEVDLAELGRAIPMLLNVRPGTEILAGAVDLEQVALRGGDESSLVLAARVSELVARQGDREVRCQPISASVDAASTAAGLNVRRADVTTGFGTLTASGTPNDVKAQLTANLAELRKQLAGVFDLGVDELGGDVTAEFAAKRNGRDQIEITAQAQARDLHYAAGDRRVALARAQAAHRGNLTLRDGALQRIETSNTTVSLDDRLQVQAKGWYAPANSTFTADLSMPQADLALLAQLAAGAGLENIKPMTGQMTGDIKLVRAQENNQLRTNGALTLQDLHVDGQPVAARGKCTWREVALVPDVGTWQAAAIDVESEPLHVALKDFSATLGESPELSGDMRVAAQLAPLLTILSGFGLMEDVPGVAGQLNADGRLRTAGGVTDISGKAEIADFTTPGDAQVAPRSAKLAYDARIDTPNDALTLRTFDLDSPLASVKLAGSISELSQTRTVKLTGNYRLSWDDVMPVVYAVAPDLREKVKISGKSESTVRFSGDLADAAGASQLAGVTALTELTWSSAQIMGIELGEAKFTPTLKNGTLTLPPAAISAAGGTVRAGGAIDMTSTPPSLKVPGELAMMEKVQITPELAQNVLSRFNPLFGQATSLSGTADLRVRDLELPLGSAVTTGGAGGGLLTLDSFQLAPGGMLAELLTLSGLAREMYVVDVSGLEFVVRDGRIHYRDLTLRFVQDKFDLKFYGSVGFDDTLDLFVSVPVGEKILERAGMRVGAAEQARLLSGLRIDIPVGGTRKNPRLNFSQVDIKGLLDNVVRKRTEDALTDGRLLDLIPGLGGRRNDDKSEDQKTDSARDPKSEDEPAEERKPTVRPKSKQKRRPRSP